MEQCMRTRNGTLVYSYTNPHLHSFSLCMYVKAGSMYESEEENGITHFFEHAVIRNVDRLMDGGLYPLLDRLGLSLGGATYKEFVQFSIGGAVKHWKEAVDIFLRLMEPLCLSEEELSIERKRVKAEIRECDKKKSLEARTEQAVWKGTSLKFPITGSKKKLDRIGVKKLAAFREKFLSAENLFFYVTGQCDENGLSYFVERLEQYPLFNGSPRRENLAPRPEQFFIRTGIPVIAKGEETEVSISFDVNTSRYSNAMLCLFFDMLFTGDYCPVYQELSEKTGYIYSYDDQFERYKNIGSLQLCYQVAPGKLLKAFEKTMDIFLDLKKKTGTLEYVRAIYLDNAELALDDDNDFNWNRAYDCHILDEAYPDLEAKKQAFKEVTEEDMAKMAREIFRTKNLTVVIKGNKKLIPERKIRKQMKRLG